MLSVYSYIFLSWSFCSPTKAHQVGSQSYSYKNMPGTVHFRSLIPTQHSFLRWPLSPCMWDSDGKAIQNTPCPQFFFCFFLFGSVQINSHTSTPSPRPGPDHSGTAKMRWFEISNACKNWEKKCWERTLSAQKFLQGLKKLEKLKWDGFKQRSAIESLWQTKFWRIWSFYKLFETYIWSW